MLNPDQFPHYGSLDASIRRGYRPGNSDADRKHNADLSREHMRLNNPPGSSRA